MKQIRSVRSKHPKSVQARMLGLALFSIILLAGVLFVYDRFTPEQKGETLTVAASASHPPSPVSPRQDKKHSHVEMASRKLSPSARH